MSAEDKARMKDHRRARRKAEAAAALPPTRLWHVPHDLALRLVEETGCGAVITRADARGLLVEGRHRAAYEALPVDRPGHIRADGAMWDGTRWELPYAYFSAGTGNPLDAGDAWTN